MEESDLELKHGTFVAGIVHHYTKHIQLKTTGAQQVTGAVKILGLTVRFLLHSLGA